MIKISKLRSEMESFLESEKKQKSIYLSGDNLDEILREAAIQLSTPIKDISYEVLQKGKKVFGMKPVEWTVLAYIGASKTKTQDISTLSLFKEDEVEVLKNEDGEFFLRSTDSYLLKVTSPIGEGHKVSLDNVLGYLLEQGIKNYDFDKVKVIVQESKGEYVSIGKRLDFNPAENPIMSVERSEDNMEAFLTISLPGLGGSDVLEADIKTLLKRQGIADKAYLEKEISNLIDNPIYGEPILVAKGLSPIDGEEGYIKFHYKKNKDFRYKESLSGQINFKEIISTQNVHKGDVLAEKIPPTMGEEGFNLDGRLLMPKRGDEASFILGTNVEISSSGNELLASCDGYISFDEKIINVQNIYTVEGDVGVKTGNIYNNGSVLIKGGVGDGYQIIVKGNLEIMGSVGKARIEAEGDIVLHSGINGNHEAVIKSKGNIWAKFIENSKVESGKTIYVSDGILHSNVIAQENIVCQGKRAKITGGSVMAYGEIISLYLGAIGSGETILEVGFNPRELIQYNKTKKWLTSLDSEIDELEKNIQVFERSKKNSSSREDKNSKDSISLESLTKDLEMIKEERLLVHESFLKAEERLHNDQLKGRISVEKTIYPKVILKINGLVYEAPNEMERVSFVADEGLIKAIPYEPLSLEKVEEKPSIEDDGKEKNSRSRKR